MLSPQRNRQLQSLEERLFQQEFVLPGLRQQKVLQKLQERLVTSRTVSHEHCEFVICPINLRSQVKVHPGLKNKDRMSLLTRISHLHNLTPSQIKDLLLRLTELGFKLINLLGWEQKDFKRFHYIRDYTRFKHALGLADAVHMSLFNLGINVRLPCKTYIKGQYRFGTRMFFSLRTRSRYGVRVINSSTTQNRKFFLLLHYLRVFPKNVPEKVYVKTIKYSMNYLFSKQMDQELPIPYRHFVPIFPSITQHKLNCNLRSNKSLRVRLYFNILQSKSLCAPVGEDMISEQNNAHFKSLCRPESEVIDVPQDYLRGLYQKCREYGMELIERKLYDPFKTTLPNLKATVENSRVKGGARASLKPDRIYSRSSHKESLRKTIKGQLEGKTKWQTSLNDYLYPTEKPHGARLEPFVIGLFGSPGSGKTTAIQVLKKLILRSHFPESMDKPEHEMIYSRSCATAHWDGYRHQPIVILDDFGQNLQDRSDLSEFEQLVSTNPYILPMASLTEKGRYFNSPIIITTSNVPFGSNVNHRGGNTATGGIVEDIDALWRRFHLSVKLERVPRLTSDEPETRMFLHDAGVESWERWSKENGISPHKLYEFDGILKCSHQLRISRERLSSSGTHHHRLKHGSGEILGPVINGVHHLHNIFEGRFEKHVRYHDEFLQSYWDQQVAQVRVEAHEPSNSDGSWVEINARKIETPYMPNDYSVVQRFPGIPPFSKPVVEVVHLPEPLKVRTITKAEAQTKVLKPFQTALWELLAQKPQFVLTAGCTRSQLLEDFETQKLQQIEKMEKHLLSMASQQLEGELFLSGDYTAATDNFPMSITDTIREGLICGMRAAGFNHEPTFSWLRWETSPHEIRYPDGKIGYQTSGQLMGSLISFPFLCIQNDYLVSISGFQTGKYFINGDDVVGCGSPEVINRWKELAPKVGLSLSLGKNFVDPDFCTVNSQLFFNGKCLHTGKVSCQTRYNKSLGFCFSETQFYFGTHDDVYDEFIRRNIVPLRQTPRSLFVCRSHGGLGLTNYPQRWDHKQSMRVYLYDLLAPFLKDVSVPGFPQLKALCLPEILEDSDIEFLANNNCEEDSSLSVLETLRSVFFKEDDIESDTIADLDHKELRKTLTILKDVVPETMWNHFFTYNLHDLPPLNFFRKRYVFFRSGSLRWVKKRVIRLVLEILFRRCKKHDATSINLDVVDPWMNHLKEEDKIASYLGSIQELFESNDSDVQNFSMDDVNSPSFSSSDISVGDSLDSDWHMFSDDPLIEPLFVERTHIPKLHPHDLLEDDVGIFDLPPLDDGLPVQSQTQEKEV